MIRDLFALYRAGLKAVCGESLINLMSADGIVRQPD